jgi:muconolactone delta-isomerase
LEFLVEFEITVPSGTSQTEVAERARAEAMAAAALVEQGHLLRVWKLPTDGDSKILGLYRADGRGQLDRLLESLPLYDWMQIAVTALEAHPNDPALQAGPTVERGGAAGNGERLPDPRLTFIYRLEATLGQSLDLGDTAHGRRRIVPLTGGTFTGPELQGTLLSGTSADWQTVLSDGTALGDIRYTLQTDRGDLLDVRSRGVRHGSAAVLARLGRGEQVDASEYTFRTATQIETAASDLDWMNKGIFIGVGGRQAGAVVYEIYLVR